MRQVATWTGLKRGRQNTRTVIGELSAASLGYGRWIVTFRPGTLITASLILQSLLKSMAKYLNARRCDLAEVVWLCFSVMTASALSEIPVILLPA